MDASPRGKYRLRERTSDCGRAVFPSPSNELASKEVYRLRTGRTTVRNKVVGPTYPPIPPAQHRTPFVTAQREARSDGQILTRRQYDTNILKPARHKRYRSTTAFLDLFSFACPSTSHYCFTNPQRLTCRITVFSREIDTNIYKMSLIMKNLIELYSYHTLILYMMNN